MCFPLLGRTGRRAKGSGSTEGGRVRGKGSPPSLPPECDGPHENLLNSRRRFDSSRGYSRRRGKSCARPVRCRPMLHNTCRAEKHSRPRWQRRSALEITLFSDMIASESERLCHLVGHPPPPLWHSRATASPRLRGLGGLAQRAGALFFRAAARGFLFVFSFSLPPAVSF